MSQMALLQYYLNYPHVHIFATKMYSISTWQDALVLHWHGFPVHTEKISSPAVLLTLNGKVDDSTLLGHLQAPTFEQKQILNIYSVKENK